MRKLILLKAVVIAAVLLLPAVSAFEVKDTGKTGTGPVLNEDFIVFLTFEDSIDEDLNSDGDMSDRIVQYYDIDTTRTRSTKTEGISYSLFEHLLVIEDQSHKLLLADLQDHSVENLNIRGRNPFLYDELISFETYESDIGEDLDGDGKTNSIIVSFARTDKPSRVTHIAEGKNPVILKEKIYFSTDEGNAEEDINNDGDLNDIVIRYYDTGSDDIKKTSAQGEIISASGNTVVFAKKQKLFLLDIVSGKTREVGEGTSAGVSENIVFENNGLLYCYNTEAEKAAKIAAGTEPALAGETLVFVYEKKITMAKGDFCVQKVSAAREFEETDETGGEGETAEAAGEQEEATQTAPASQPKKPARVTGSAVEEPKERKPLPDQLPKKSDDEGVAYWFLVAVAMTSIGIIIYFVMPNYVKRRRKGFGF